MNCPLGTHSSRTTSNQNLLLLGMIFWQLVDDFGAGHHSLTKWFGFSVATLVNSSEKVVIVWLPP